MAFQKVLKHKCGKITNRLVKRIEKLLQYEALQIFHCSEIFLFELRLQEYLLDIIQFLLFVQVSINFNK